MRGYGLPRNQDVEYPDMCDLHTYGLNSSAGCLKGKGGDIRSHQHTDNKQTARRYWKKRERQRVKRELNCEDC